MAYAYWKSGKHNDDAVFDLFFRKNPFQGEFTVFAGLEDCIRFLQAFHYSESGMGHFAVLCSSRELKHEVVYECMNVYVLSGDTQRA